MELVAAPRYGFPVSTTCRKCGATGPVMITGPEADQAWDNRPLNGKPTTPESKALPLEASDLMTMALDGQTPPILRVLATYAIASNWIQLYGGKRSPDKAYQVKACEWAFIGPMRPPYELAQWALGSQSLDSISELKTGRQL